MSDPSRRDVLAGAACLAAGPMLTLPAVACAPAAPLAFQPSSLLLEHRRLAVRVLAIKAVNPLDHLYALDAAGLLPHTMTSEEIEAMTEPPQARHQAAIDTHMPALAAVSRAIWATPATSWSDIVARAELVAFWRYPMSDETYHGHDDPFAEKKLVDAIIAVAVEDCGLWPSRVWTAAPLPAFEPPTLLIEYRRLDGLWEERWLEAEPTSDERFAHFDATYRIESALLKTPATCWADIALRAELTAHHRNDCQPTASVLSNPVDDEGRLCPHRSFAELLVAVMQLGNCVWPIDLSDVVWEQTHCELWAEARAKSRVYHAEVKALRKDWLSLSRVTA